MSVESAKAFIERVKNDEDFKKKVFEIKEKQERKDLVKAEGFDFTADELKEASGGELSEDELDSVAGGLMCFNFKLW
jgi:predicted ribosomally synthesized peptide with nif11-like leader